MTMEEDEDSMYLLGPREDRAKNPNRSHFLRMLSPSKDFLMNSYARFLLIHLFCCVFFSLRVTMDYNLPNMIHLILTLLLLILVSSLIWLSMFILFKIAFQFSRSLYLPS